MKWSLVTANLFKTMLWFGPSSQRNRFGSGGKKGLNGFLAGRVSVLFVEIEVGFLAREGTRRI